MFHRVLSGLTIIYSLCLSQAQMVGPQRPYVPLEFPAPQYQQEILVRFTSPQAAARAVISIAPLWDGRDWAVSCRWDDNDSSNTAMSENMAEHGQSGTFYLIGIYSDWSQGTPVLDFPWGRNLLAKGASIGCHSLTHPMLAFNSRSRMMEEVLGDRIQWEAAVDQPVMSYAFSYTNFTTPQEGLVVQADIARLLERCGFYSVASEPTFEDIDTELALSPIMPSDGAIIDPYVRTALGSAAFKAAHPNLTYSMHPWFYSTPELWAELDAEFETYGHNPNWWYCNQNQYGAYRYQYQRAKLSVAQISGDTLTLHLDRPMLLDLNDAIPLTLQIAGVTNAEISSVQCATADCKPSDHDPSLFHIFHDRNQALPTKIGLVPLNFANRDTLGPNDWDSDFPQLRALLHWDGAQLKLMVQNQSTGQLSNLRVTYRLPLMWKEGVVRRDLPDVPASQTATDSLQPTQSQTDLRYTMGRGFLAAQLDFTLGGQPGRLHVGCLTANDPHTDPSYPCDGFVLLGPIPPTQLNTDAFAQTIQEGPLNLTNWVTPDGTQYTWRNSDAARQPQLDVEMIPLTRMFVPNPGWCVLATRIQSPQAQKLDLLFYNGPTRAFFNGAEVSANATVDLKQGANELVFLTVEWSGFYLRMAAPGTQDRAKDIRYERPFPNVPLDVSLAGTMLQLSWPLTADEFILETAPSLTAPINWTSVNASPVDAQGKHTVKQNTLPVSAYYRLRKL